MEKIINKREANMNYAKILSDLIPISSYLDSGALRSEIGDLYFDVIMVDELAFGTLTYVPEKISNLDDIEDRIIKLKKGGVLINDLLAMSNLTLNLAARQSLLLTELARTIALECLIGYNRSAPPSSGPYVPT